jgi:uncharacterized protein YcnI
MKIFILSILFLFALTPQAFAHVVVKPNTVAAAAFQTFTTSVPNEKDNPTIGLRLIIPTGLKSISPNVKPGWTISVKKEGDVVTEIEWTEGSIPAGQRDDFLFSAQAPAEETTLVWKAFQTYEDGEVVAWDHDAKESTHDEKMEDDKPHTPASKTEVVEGDLNEKSDHETPQQVITKTNNSTPIVSYLALAVSVIALTFSLKKK